MLLHRELRINDTKDGKPRSRSIFFGQADSPAEIALISRLRYDVYAKRGYIDPARFPDKMESDEYDRTGKCFYFMATIEGKVIGCIRVIVDDPLPTELDFRFEEPRELAAIPRSKRSELGRFIIIPPDREKGDFLPRGLTMLFLLDAISAFGRDHGLLGGYSFIKKSLETKLRKIKAPIGEIRGYEQRYPQDGILYRYFSQPEDPVVPMYFITDDFLRFCGKMIGNSRMFETLSPTVTELRSNLYTAFLRAMKII